MSCSRFCPIHFVQLRIILFVKSGMLAPLDRLEFRNKNKSSEIKKKKMGKER